jgi:shikimate kinase
MTQVDYYDYEPTVTLLRPVAFIGHPGCATSEIVYDLAALTGLALHDLDRRIEHEVGQNLWAYARQHGAHALRQQQAALLPGVLAQQPPGLILLGEGVVLDLELLSQVKAWTVLVFLELPAAACYWALRQRIRQHEGTLMHPWLPDRLDDVQDLWPFLERMQPVMAAAEHRIRTAGQSVHEVVLTLQGLLATLGTHRGSRND